MRPRSGHPTEKAKERVEAKESHQVSYSDIQHAEQSIAVGITNLKKLVELRRKKKPIEYDAQGIAIVFVSADELSNELKKAAEEKKEDANGELSNADVLSHLPTRGKHGARKEGMTVLLYREGFTSAPPIRFMAQQKVDSLCFAASHLVSLGLDEKAVQAVSENMKATIEKEFSDLFKKYGKDKKELAEKGAEFIQKITQKTLAELCRLWIDANPEKFDKHPRAREQALVKINKIVELITGYASHQRSSGADSIVFDEGRGIFSADILFTSDDKPSAHNRHKKIPIGNVSYALEGRVDDKGNAHVTSSVLKHPTPVAIDDLRTQKEDRSILDDQLEIILDACNRIEEINAAKLAFIRCGIDSGEPIVVDSTYQVLTTNFFDMQKQASAYQAVVVAYALMNGSSVGQAVFNTSVFNAGINTWGEWNARSKGAAEVQKGENAKAYIELSKAAAKELVHLKPFESLKVETTDKHGQLIQETADAFLSYGVKTTADSLWDVDQFIKISQQFQSVFAPQAESASKTVREGYLIQLAKAKAEFMKLRAMSPQPKEKLREAARQVIFYNKALGEHAIVAEEDAKKDYYEKSKGTSLKDLIKELGSNDVVKQLVKAAKENEKAAKLLHSLTVLTYKTYLDELYYSGKYREPKNAAIFNAYLAAYQRLVGMLADTGCKSANDRTYIARLFLAAVEGRVLEEQPLPPDLTSEKTYARFAERDLSERAMTNVAVVSVAGDTSGAAPKTQKGKKKGYDTNSYAYLEKVEDVGALGKFGRCASDKQADRKDLEKLKEAVASEVFKPSQSPTLSPKSFSERMFFWRSKEQTTVTVPVANDDSNQKKNGHKSSH